jgi:hypothetical protein
MGCLWKTQLALIIFLVNRVLGIGAQVLSCGADWRGLHMGEET